jgi:hypothetical protein
MLRSVGRRLQAMTGGVGMGMDKAMGGLPFYGNMYMGRVNPDDYQPSQYSTSEEARSAFLTYQKVYADDDPYIRVKLDKCPYFALCDMVVWHGMAPTFLDPGLLTNEEHHLLLLYSRAYYEKWEAIHSLPREIAPKPRIKKGRFELARRLMEHAACDKHQIKRAQDLLIDDASFVGMNPNLWRTAHLDEGLRNTLTGRVLEFAGLTETQMADIFETLERMRTIVVKRKDVNRFNDNVFAITGEVDHEAAVRAREVSEASVTLDTGDDGLEFQQFKFADAYTLYNLYKLLGLESYTGQLKCYSYIDRQQTPLQISINDEDIYFDYLVTSFFKANLHITTGSTSPFAITVEDKTRAEFATGRWF